MWKLSILILFLAACGSSPGDTSINISNNNAATNNNGQTSSKAPAASSASSAPMLTGEQVICNYCLSFADAVKQDKCLSANGLTPKDC